MWSPKQRLGNSAEARAAAHLTKAGLKHLSSNYRCKCGEIDLIMRDGEQLVFVEVRYRKSDRYGSAAATVDARKQRRLILTAQHYLQRYRDTGPCRFDVVGICGNGSIDWRRDAFGE